MLSDQRQHAASGGAVICARQRCPRTCRRARVTLPTMACSATAQTPSDRSHAATPTQAQPRTLSTATLLPDFLVLSPLLQQQALRRKPIVQPSYRIHEGEDGPTNSDPAADCYRLLSPSWEPIIGESRQTQKLRRQVCGICQPQGQSTRPLSASQVAGSLRSECSQSPAAQPS